MTSANLRILVPVDGSEASHRAAQHVVDLASRQLPLDIHVLNVQPDLRGVASFVSAADVESFHRDEGMKTMAESLRLFETAGHKAHAHVGVGDPGTIVLAFAQRLNCDQIVMGTRGHGAVTSAVLGSVAWKVVGSATVPVTLVR
jgi:nucleotide-binding universal stress UspA family protein